MEEAFVSLNKPLLFDASSIIYLTKAGCINLFFKSSKCYTTSEIVKELYVKNDNAAFLVKQGKIRVLEEKSRSEAFGKLSRADRELLELQALYGYILISDDKLISLYCEENKLCHLNSLSAVAYLYLRGDVELNYAYDLINKLSKIGMYSKPVVKYAFSLLP
jgi:hypothetical protein